MQCGRKFLVPAARGLAACTAFGFPQSQSVCSADQGPERTFTREEVAKHDCEANGVWLTYKDGVYDVSKFIHKHPGGVDRIMLGAGGDATGFLEYWAVHRQPLAQSVLAKFRIGRLAESEKSQNLVMDDPYEDEPERSPGLRGLWAGLSDDQPFVAEPRILPHTFKTPNHLFYVRNHAPVPIAADPQESHAVDVYLEDDLHTEWTLKSLNEKFPSVEFHSALQCSGNRLGEMFSQLTPGTAAHASWRGKTDVSGYQIGNALWSGIPLAALLREVIKEHGAFKFVEFHGEDQYFISMPLDAVVEDSNDVLLATHMNGEPLPPDHGAPVRLLIPGVVGCRSVKWLNKIVLRNDAGDSPWTQYFYKHKGKPILHWPIQSMITLVQGLPASELHVDTAPAARREVAVKEDGLHIAGFAYVGGGRSVVRVEVSADGGVSWQDAALCDNEMRPSGKQWAWTLWKATVAVPQCTGNGSTVSLCCRAWDSEMQTQPLTPSHALANTPSGYLFNPIHRVSATVITKGNPDYITAET